MNGALAAPAGDLAELYPGMCRPSIAPEQLVGGWYLVRFGSELNSELLAKRALWCVRTILIARSAERRDPVFAPKRLAEKARSTSARDLLSNRRGRHDDNVVRDLLHRFLKDEVPGERMLEHAERDAFIKTFAATSNKVALQTLRQQNNFNITYLLQVYKLIIYHLMS